MSQVRDSVLRQLSSVAMEELPVLVRFLLQSATATDALDIAVELRKHLVLDASTARRQGQKSVLGGDQSNVLFLLEMLSLKSF